MLQMSPQDGGVPMLTFEYVQHFVGDIFAADIVGTFCKLLPDDVESRTPNLILSQLNSCRGEVYRDRVRLYDPLRAGCGAGGCRRFCRFIVQQRHIIRDSIIYFHNVLLSPG